MEVGQPWDAECEKTSRRYYCIWMEGRLFATMILVVECDLLDTATAARTPPSGRIDAKNRPRGSECVAE